MQDADPGLWHLPHDAVSEGDPQRVHTWCRSSFLLSFPLAAGRSSLARQGLVATPLGPIVLSAGSGGSSPCAQPLQPSPHAPSPKNHHRSPPAPPLGWAQGGFRGCCLITPPSNLPLDVWSLINPPCTPRRAQCLPVRARFLLVFQLLAKAPAHTCCALGLEAVISEALDFLLM